MPDVGFEGQTTLRTPAPTGAVQYHQWLDKAPTVNVKVEKNSRGFNFEATVLGARSTEEAMTLLRELTDSLNEVYGGSA